MPIVSLSLNDQILEALSELQQDLGFSGRSEAIRAAIRQFISDRQQRSEYRGKVEAVIIAIHGEDGASAVDVIRHDHYQLIQTQIHHHIKKHQCMDIFVVRGQSEAVNSFIDGLSKAEDIEYTKVFFL